MAVLPILYGVIVYAVDIPYIDEWETVALLQRYSQGRLTFLDLLTPQNSYRQLVSNLLFIALGATVQLNLKWEMFLTVLMVAHTGWMWAGTLRRVAAMPFLVVAGISLFLFSALFTAKQHENWVLGMQFVYVFPVYCLTVCTRVAVSDRRFLVRSAIVVPVCVLCTFSSANGLLCWLALLPLAWGTGIPDTRPRTWPWLALWCAVAALSVGGYLYDYQQPVHRIELSTQWPPLTTVVTYFVRVVGNGYGTRLSAPLIEIVGTLTLIGWLIGCGIVVRLRHDRDTIGALLPWVVLGLYGLGNAILITIGRSHLGPDQALASRYPGLTLFLGLSVAILPVIASYRRPECRRLQVFAWAMGVWMLAATTLKWARHGDDFARLTRFTQEIALGKAGLLVGAHLPYAEHRFQIFFPAAAFGTYQYRLESLTSLADWLDANHLLRPGLIREPYLTQSRQHPTAVLGRFAEVSWRHDTVVATGQVEDTALLPLRQAVIITSQEVSGRRRFVGIDNAGTAAWTVAIPAHRLQREDLRLEAWLLDGETGMFRAIPGSHAVPR